MPQRIAAEDLRARLYGQGEVALLDVREPGQTVLGHILFSAPLPYSRFELDLPRLVPNTAVPMVLVDDGDGVAERAAARAEALGYRDVQCLTGGAAAWEGAGHTLYQGVNVPSKAFGELVEHAADTPRLTAEDVAKMKAAAADMVIVDGRPLEEFVKMNIPGGTCCPNGELALRIERLAPDPSTKIVVNCAGRTRSIIGAQTLIDLGVPNPVYALENGTQGWVLAGLDLEHGKTGAVPGAPESLERQRARAAELGQRFGVERVVPETLAGWLQDGTRTTYLLDVRTAAERQDDPAERKSIIARHGIQHAPGGQLVQATDQWIGVRRARVVVLDTEDVRAPVTASWLRRLGHDAVTLTGGLDALRDVAAAGHPQCPDLPDLAPIRPADLQRRIADGSMAVVDLRASEAYRAGHVPGAVWGVRPRLGRLDLAPAIALIADDAAVARLAACDLSEMGMADIALLDGGMTAWTAAGLPTEATPDSPPDAERIDFLSFTHGRHHGDLDASRQYLAWEIALVDQLDADERAVFRV